MSEQILLQGKILGIEEFLLARAGEGTLFPLGGRGACSPGARSGSRCSARCCRARCWPNWAWRASCSARAAAASSWWCCPAKRGPRPSQFLEAAARQIGRDERRPREADLGRHGEPGRLGRGPQAPQRSAAAAAAPPRLPKPAPPRFEPFTAPPAGASDAYFPGNSARKLREAQHRRLVAGEPRHGAARRRQAHLEPHARIFRRTASCWRATPRRPTTASRPRRCRRWRRRAQGRSVWGVLRGDVDNFGVRLRRVHNIEEHVPLSVLYKQFFAGELEVLCSMPEFWRKVSIIYSGGDDFAVYGSWDALIALAREVQRLFHRFTEENLKDYPGRRGQDHLDGASRSRRRRTTRSARSTSRPGATWNWPSPPTRTASTCWAACSNGSSWPTPRNSRTR